MVVYLIAYNNWSWSIHLNCTLNLCVFVQMILHLLYLIILSIEYFTLFKVFRVSRNAIRPLIYVCHMMLDYDDEGECVLARALVYVFVCVHACVFMCLCDFVWMYVCDCVCMGVGVYEAHDCFSLYYCQLF